MSGATELVAVNLNTKDVTAEGVNIKIGPLVMGDGTGEIISFTLKKQIPEDPNSFYYKGQLYLIAKKDGDWFECIAIEFTSV